jgi:acetylornithine deacetylase/succinyl-diaminopimelate desuccinylase-like protein
MPLIRSAQVDLSGMKFMKCGLVVTAAALMFVSAGSAFAADIPPDEQAFRDIYKELVETNTTASSGSCTLAASRMGARLKHGGFTDAEIHYFHDDAYPKEGGIVFIWPGSDPKLKALLLVAHLDVVEAKREDWTRDPFKLVEENGYFYGRGTSDDKEQDAIWVDTMIRLRKAGFAHRRTLKMALTCGEEGGSIFNGVEYLVKHDLPLIDAAFALNEGGEGELDEKGQRVALNIEAAEKTYQDFTLEVTNPGGHSSVPIKDNAIYHLADALVKVRDYEFPVMMTDATRTYFDRMSALEQDPAVKSAMQAIARDPNDAAADAELSKNRIWHSMLRTTCVATLLEAGHATNALPQRARANVNCRMFPGVTTEQTRQQLIQVIGNPDVTVTPRPPIALVLGSPTLTKEILGPIEQVAAKSFPGVPVIPKLETGATDGRTLTAAGIPTYGVDGAFVDVDLGNIHGLNERIAVKSLLESRAFLFELVKIYANP